MTLSSTTVLGVVGMLSLLVPSLSVGSDASHHDLSGQPAIVVAEAPRSPAVSMPIYAPPRRGTPSAEHRVGGGTRAGKSVPVIAVIAPDHAGLTISEQPTLYWFTSGPIQGPVEITVTDMHTIPPVLEKRLTPPTTAGIQRVNLADYGVHLKPGIHYEWSISIVMDSGRRSLDVSAAGSIERVEPSSVQAQLDQAAPLDPPQRFAAAGLWYDAVMSLSELIDAQPANRELRRQRAGLLEQVGLKEASAFDRS